VLDFLPEKPTGSGSGVLEYAAGVDPPLDALGLGSWWPSGRVQVFMEYFHNGLDIPWWGTIMIATFCMRIIVFPLVVMSQKNVAKLQNNNLEMQELQEEMTIARRRGDHLESAIAGQKLQAFMKEKGINPLKNMLPIMFQAPIFMSMFFGLRGLANLPMESMIGGGLGWFADMTVPDPYYALPLCTSALTYFQIKMGADGIQLPQKKFFANIMLVALPCIMFPITMNFSAAVQFYWFFNNTISVGQTTLVRTPACRKALGIPPMTKRPPPPAEKSTGPKKGIMETMRESVDNFRMQSELIDRRAHDEQMFRKAGMATRKRTFKFDPTKPKRRIK